MGGLGKRNSAEDALKLEELGHAYKAVDHLGSRLLRSIFLCDYVAIPDFRRETQILGAG